MLAEGELIYKEKKGGDITQLRATPESREQTWKIHYTIPSSKINHINHNFILVDMLSFLMHWIPCKSQIK